MRLAAKHPYSLGDGNYEIVPIIERTSEPTVTDTLTVLK